eukprot:75290-Hanusia_phi.AAC.2
MPLRSGAMVNDLLLPASILLLVSSLLVGIVIKSTSKKRKAASNPPSPSFSVSPKQADAVHNHTKVHRSTLLEDLICEQRRSQRSLSVIEAPRFRETSISPERRSPTGSFASAAPTRYVSKSYLHRSSSGSRYYASIVARNFAVYDATLEEIEQGRERDFAFQRMPSCPTYQPEYNADGMVKRVRSGGM